MRRGHLLFTTCFHTHPQGSSLMWVLEIQSPHTCVAKCFSYGVVSQMNALSLSHTCIWTPTGTPTCTHVHTYHPQAYAHVHVHAHIYACTHMHTYMYTHRHTHMHPPPHFTTIEGIVPCLCKSQNVTESQFTKCLMPVYSSSVTPQRSSWEVGGHEPEGGDYVL